MKTYMYDVAVLDDAIAGLKRDSDKLQNKVHNLLISTLFVWTKAGKERAPEVAAKTAERLTLIQQNSPWHANSVAAWIAAKVPGLTWNDEEKVWRVAADATQVNDCRLLTDTYKEIRDGQTFFEFKPAQAPKPYLFQEVIENAVKNARSRAAKPKNEKDDIPLSLVAAVAQAVEDWERNKEAA